MRHEGWVNPYDKDKWELDISTLMCTQQTGDEVRFMKNSLRKCLYDEYEAGADAITPIVAKAIFELMTDDKYTKVLFHKGTYPELKAKLGEFFTLEDG